MTGPAVSVIVPVYSPGPYIRPLLDCLDRQKPPAGGFEVLFVDDGSTDATASLLERWAEDRAWATVIRLPRSGWPSLPRNVGIERARGEFVFFVDHDDWLAHDALARMTAFARESGSDVVLGWMKGLGRNVPVRLFSRTVADARPPGTPLHDSMTVHAMFRTAFLHEAGLRFDESLRRLEDHLFMAAAYTRARRISVLADSPVYLHAAREDSANAGHRPYGAAEYYEALGRTIDIVIEAGVPRPEKHAYLGRWIRIEMLDRLSSEAVRSLPAEDRDAFFTEVQTLLRRVPDDVVESLPGRYRSEAKRLLGMTPAEFWESERERLVSEPRSGAGTRAAARARLVDALSRRAPRWLQRRVVTWGRTPSALARDAGAAAAVVSAAIAAGAALAAPLASVAFTAGAALLTAWLAARSLTPWATAVRQIITLAPAAIAAAAHSDLAAGTATATTAGLIVAALALDRWWRRRDVRCYPTREGGPLSRLGYIGLTACAVSAAIVATVAFAVLR